MKKTRIPRRPLARAIDRMARLEPWGAGPQQKKTHQQELDAARADALKGTRS